MYYVRAQLIFLKCILYIEIMVQNRRNGWADFSDKGMKKFFEYPCKGCLAAKNKTHSNHKRQSDIAKNGNTRFK